MAFEERPPRRRRYKPLLTRLPWHCGSVSVVEVFRYMNHIPGQRGHINEGVGFIMRGDVVDGVLAEIRRTY